jgi:hypothetical protein
MRKVARPPIAAEALAAAAEVVKCFGHARYAFTCGGAGKR